MEIICVTVVNRPLPFVVDSHIFPDHSPLVLSLLQPEFEFRVVLCEPNCVLVVHQFLVLLHDWHPVGVVVGVVLIRHMHSRHFCFKVLLVFQVESQDMSVVNLVCCCLEKAPFLVNLMQDLSVLIF
jgi:hypothetical protein